jgi:hypothetical protein
MHRKVKEVLQKLKFNCPGCKVVYSYDDVIDHASKCDKVDVKLKLTQAQIAQTVALNNTNVVSSLPVVASKASQMSNEVFVLDKDFYRVYIFNLLTRQALSFELIY